jgi:NADH-quinone oxidoreductase subunit J
MTTHTFIWLLEGLVVAAAIMIILSRTVFHAAINLLVVIIAIGSLFGLFGSEFLFIAQIMLYGGGIVVLILFATMVTKSGTTMQPQLPASKLLPLVFVALGVSAMLSGYALYAQPRGVPHVVETQMLGKSLLLHYALPLELSGILLLAALVGAAVASMQKPTEV